MKADIMEAHLRYLAQSANTLNANVRQLCMDVRKDPAQDLEFQREMVRSSLSSVRSWFEEMERSLDAARSEASE